MKTIEWITGKCDMEIARRLGETLNLPSLTAKLLAVRGAVTAQDAKAFTEKGIENLNDPFLLKDMDKAVARIKKAIADGEKVAVYGDYDADGVTATYVVLHYLKSCGVECTYHIPDRFGDGYGVSENALLSLQKEGVSLIITVDTGITAVSESCFAKSLGMDMVITDHHKCGEELPDACAVVNPNRDDCSYPFDGLAGVGVAFKLVSALSDSRAEILEKYLPYVCIGTVADVMPIIGENRVIVANGLRILSEYSEVGLSALLDEAGAKKTEPLTAGAVGFLVGPRMNAAGRMGSASLALELLFADAATAPELAALLGEKNRERQKCEADIMQEALAVLEEHPEYKENAAIVIDGKKWHHGVLGIVASRICNMFEKPAILISSDEDECRGSGRSVEGVSLHAALGRCSDILEKFGGHDLAAGIVIKPENIAEFRRRISEELQPDMEGYIPTLNIDFEVEPNELTIEQLRALRVMEPYGKMNDAPCVRLNKCRVTQVTPIGNNRHVKLVLERMGRFQSVYFGKRITDMPFAEGDYVDVAFTPEINKFYGESVQLHIKDVKPCEANLIEIEKALSVLEGAKNGNKCDGVEISYDELGKVWRVLTRLDTSNSLAITEAWRSVYQQCRSITVSKFFIALQIFSEVGLADYEFENFRVCIKIADRNDKVDINDSGTYRLYKSCGSR